MRKSGIIYPLSGNSFYGSVYIFEKTVGFIDSTKDKKYEGIVSVSDYKASVTTTDIYGSYIKQPRPSFRASSETIIRKESSKQETDLWFSRLISNTEDDRSKDAEYRSSKSKNERVSVTGKVEKYDKQVEPTKKVNEGDKVRNDKNKSDKDRSDERMYSDSAFNRQEKIEKKSGEKKLDVKSSNSTIKGDQNREKSKEDRLVNILYIFEIINWFMDLDVVGKFIIGLVGGVIAFFIIFSQLGFSSLLSTLR